VQLCWWGVVYVWAGGRLMYVCIRVVGLVLVWLCFCVCALVCKHVGFV